MNVEPVSPQSFAAAHAAALTLLSDELAAVRGLPARARDFFRDGIPRSVPG